MQDKKRSHQFRRALIKLKFQIIQALSFQLIQAVTLIGIIKNKINSMTSSQWIKIHREAKVEINYKKVH